MSYASTNNIRSDSLQILLQKAKAICTVNRESLTFIQSRRGQQVIIRREYHLNTTKQCIHKSRKMTHSSVFDVNIADIDNNDDNRKELTMTSNDTKKDIDDVYLSCRNIV